MRTTFKFFATLTTIFITFNAFGQKTPTWNQNLPPLATLIQEKKEIKLSYARTTNVFKGQDFSGGLAALAKDFPILNPLVGALDGKVSEEIWEPIIEKRVSLLEGEDNGVKFGSFFRTRDEGIDPSSIVLPVKTGELLPFLLSLKDGGNADVGLFGSYYPEIDFVGFKIGKTDIYLDAGGSFEAFYPGSFKYQLTKSPLNYAEKILPGWAVPDKNEARQIVAESLDSGFPIAFNLIGGLSLYSSDIPIKHWGNISFNLQSNFSFARYSWGTGRSWIFSFGTIYTPTEKK
jgi:hypothetical protein